MAGFESLSIYDAPGVVFSNVLDGEFTARGAYNAFVSPSRLTPAERDTIATRMKTAAGKSTVAHALIDVALNPWVWFMFATSAVGGEALASTKNGIFQVAPRYSAFVKEHAPWLAQIGALTPMQLLRGTAASPVYNRVAQGMEKMSQEEGSIIGAKIEALLKRTGLPTLDFSSSKLKDAGKQALAKRISFALQGSLEAWHTDRNVRIFTGLEGTTPKFKDEIVKAITSSNMDDELFKIAGKEGVDLKNSIRQALDQRLIRLYGKETSATFIPDSAKIQRVWRGLSNPIVNGTSSKDPNMGVELIRSVLGDEIGELVKSGKLSQKAFNDIVTTSFGGGVNKNYFPRNLLETVGLDGRAVPIEALERRKIATAISSSPSAIARIKGMGTYHPEDLAYVDATFGGTKELSEQFKSSAKMLTEAQKNNELPRFLRINAEKGLHRHFNDTARTWSWHVQDVGDEVVAAQKATYPHADVKTAIERGLQPTFEEPIRARPGRAWINTPFDAVPPSERPPGGFTLADAAYGNWALTKDPYAAHVQAHLLVPAAVGRQSVRHLASQGALIQAKMSAAAFSESAVGKAIEGVGPMGKDFIGRLRTFADPTLAAEEAGQGVRGLAKYLYVTHLGLNMSSVILNMTQPMLLGATWLGTQNVVKGYGSAFKELFNYVEDRVKTYGVKAISASEKRTLIQKHFKYANASGEDLLHIAPDIFETLEGPTFGSVRSYETPSRADRVFELMMKGFEKAEWINRSVTAHAVENAYASAGKLPVGPIFTKDVREAVAESQFAGNFLNTPVMFQSADPALSATGRIFANPLGRQFLSFPLRSMIGAFVVGPTLGGRSWGKGVANDFFRGMGISAVLYEATKNIIGADLSKALYASAATDFAGKRLSEGQAPIPVPPIIDIPSSMVIAAMTGDKDMFQYTLPRLIPGGVALSRMLGVAPQAPNPLKQLQRSYAGWDQIDANGNVPVFDSEGNLKNFEHATDLIMKAGGVDMGKFQDSAARDKFLVDNRDEIISYRKEFKRALMTNNFAKAAKVKAEFETRFSGVVLTVTQAELEQDKRLMNTPRTERILDRMPANVRGQYQRIVAQSVGNRSNVPVGSLEGVSTSKQRDPMRRQVAGATSQDALDAARRLEGSSGPGEGGNKLPPFKGY